MGCRPPVISTLQAPPRITLVCRKKKELEQAVMILWSYITKVKLQYPHVTLMLQYMQTKFCSRLKKNLHLGLGCAHQCGSRLKEARSVTKWQILLRFNGGAALTSVKSFLGFRVIFFISSFFNWSSLPQMNGMPYRRRPSQSGWTSTWKRWDILTCTFWSLYILKNIKTTVFYNDLRVGSNMSAEKLCVDFLKCMFAVYAVTWYLVDDEKWETDFFVN